jgi:hypothetical protein
LAISITYLLKVRVHGRYGLESSSIVSNANWGIYASRLGLGHGIFEATRWSGALAQSVLGSNPWFVRGGQPENIAGAGVEAISRTDGNGWSSYGFRGVVVIR